MRILIDERFLDLFKHKHTSNLLPSMKPSYEIPQPKFDSLNEVNFRKGFITLLTKALNFQTDLNRFKNMFIEYVHETLNWEFNKAVRVAKKMKDIYCFNILTNYQWYSMIMFRLGVSDYIKANIFTFETGSEIAEYLPVSTKIKEKVLDFSEKLDKAINTNVLLNLENDRLLLILEYLNKLLLTQTVVVYPYVYSDTGITFSLVNNNVLDQFITKMTKYESLIEHTRNENIYIPKLLKDLPYYRSKPIKI